MGYGTMEEIRGLSSRVVIQALYYENFLADYESAWVELNKESDGS